MNNPNLAATFNIGSSLCTSVCTVLRKAQPALHAGSGLDVHRGVKDLDRLLVTAPDFVCIFTLEREAIWVCP